MYLGIFKQISSSLELFNENIHSPRRDHLGTEKRLFSRSCMSFTLSFWTIRQQKSAWINVISYLRFWIERIIRKLKTNLIISLKRISQLEQFMIKYEDLFTLATIAAILVPFPPHPHSPTKHRCKRRLGSRTHGQYLSRCSMGQIFRSFLQGNFHLTTCDTRTSDGWKKLHKLVQTFGTKFYGKWLK